MSSLTEKDKDNLKEIYKMIVRLDKNLEEVEKEVKRLSTRKKDVI